MDKFIDLVPIKGEDLYLIIAKRDIPHYGIKKGDKGGRVCKHTKLVNSWVDKSSIVRNCTLKNCEVYNCFINTARVENCNLSKSFLNNVDALNCIIIAYKISNFMLTNVKCVNTKSDRPMLNGYITSAGSITDSYIKGATIEISKETALANGGRFNNIYIVGEVNLANNKEIKSYISHGITYTFTKDIKVGGVKVDLHPPVSLAHYEKTLKPNSYEAREYLELKDFMLKTHLGG